MAHAMAVHSKEGTTATSYSVAGSARRALIEAGFSVTKRAGFGKKRHSLSAVFEKSASNSPALFGTNAPEHSRANAVENRPNLSATAQPKNGTSQTGAASSGYDVLVIGAGLALSLIPLSEPTKLLNNPYAVFCLKKKKKTNYKIKENH